MSELGVFRQRQPLGRHRVLLGNDARVALLEKILAAKAGADVGLAAELQVDVAVPKGLGPVRREVMHAEGHVRRLLPEQLEKLREHVELEIVRRGVAKIRSSSMTAVWTGSSSDFAFSVSTILRPT
jgi:hypothetical protein